MTAQSKIRVRPRSLSLPGLAVMAALASGLGGCMTDQEFADLHDTKKRHPIGYSGRGEALYVELARDGHGLSENQRADVVRFVERYKQESSGSLRIAAPQSAGGHLAASGVLREIEGIVQTAGLDSRSVEVMRTNAASAHGPAIRMVYDKTVAVAPQCADWGTDLGENRERLPFNNFGCATERNLAMTVANGRDLEVPQAETPSPSERRSNNWSSYAGPASGSGQSSSGGGGGSSDKNPSPGKP